METDALVIGAGPVGLFQVFELGLLEIQAHVVDVLPYPGGQCIELYADKPIYDIPGLPRCTGRELTDRLMQQIAPMHAGFHFGQEVSVLKPLPDGRFEVATSAGTAFIARTVFIAGGVGSFQPRRLKVDGLEAFEGSQVFHQAAEAGALAGRHVLIAGDGDAALETALALSNTGNRDGAAAPASVTLMHRRDVFTAAPVTIEAMRERCAAGAMQFVAGQAVGVLRSAGRMTHLRILQADGATQDLRVDVVLVCLGLSPKLGPIADWGLALARKQLVVDTERFQTSTPGIFAVGDVNTYPGKKKLILCGFHEAALASFAAAAHLRGGAAPPLEYTTSSTRLHKILGV